MNIFSFNPDAVKFKPFKDHGRDALFASLLLPDGRVLEDVISWPDSGAFVRDVSQPNPHSR